MQASPPLSDIAVDSESLIKAK